MADDYWTLNRLGIQHTFILQAHLPLIKVGRATDQQLQCKGNCKTVLFVWLHALPPRKWSGNSTSLHGMLCQTLLVTLT